MTNTHVLPHLNGTHLLSQLDPRIRIVASILFAVSVISLQTIPLLLAALVVGCLLLWCSSLTWANSLRKVLAMDTFIIMMLLLLPFTVPVNSPSDLWFSVFGLAASWHGFLQAVTIALKANSTMLALLALVGSMEAVLLGQALGKMKVPAALVHLMLFTVRYIDVLRGEYVRLRQAMKARAFKPANNWHTYRSIGYLFGMMLVRSVERSERVMEAMKCRGFRGQLPMLVQWHWRPMDTYFGLLMLAIIIVLLVLEHVYALV